MSAAPSMNPPAAPAAIVHPPLIARRVLVAAAALTGFAALQLTSRSMPVTPSPQLPHAAVSERGHTSADALSVQGESVISSTLGRSDPAFAAVRSHEGYRLGGGGVSAALGSRGRTIRVAGGTLSTGLLGVARGARSASPGEVQPVAQGGRVTYRYPGVQEWYAAGPLGIEQGFTLQRRPAGAGGTITLELALGGSLRAQQQDRQILFLGNGGTVSARYGGLAAVDAGGRALAARMEVRGKVLMLRVDDRAARYPLTIDPLVQVGSKQAAEAGKTIALGKSVALSRDGNTALVGGPLDNNSTGAVWVFTRSGWTWSQQGSKLTASDEVGHATFGQSVAISADGNTALIAGPYDNVSSGSTGPAGAGAVWVFTRSSSHWAQGPKLTSRGEAIQTGFGSGVSISADGNAALIGGAGSIFGTMGNFQYGGAWVFTRSGSSWTQQGPALVAPDSTRESSFGASVALSGNGDTALIGGPGDSPDMSKPGQMVGRGAVWAFVRSGSGWTQQGSKLTASDEVGYGDFGAGIALSSDGNTALIGGFGYGTSGPGGAWAFTRSAANWTQQGSKLLPRETTSGFGDSVAMSASGDTALIGAPYDNQGRGAAWLFTRSGTGWSQQGSKLTASDEVGRGTFGLSVALSADGQTGLIGGPSDNSLEGPDPSKNATPGAAWLFAVDTAPPVISGLPAPVAQATGVTGAIVRYDSPTAVDAADGPVAVICDPRSGSWFPPGTTRVKCSASDRSGNRATGGFDVTVLPSGTVPSGFVSGSAIVPAARPTVAAVLRSGGYTYSFKAAKPGIATISWYVVPSGAKLSKTGPQPVLVASGSARFGRAGASVKIKIKLTARGKSLLRQARKPLKLIAKGSYTAKGRRALVTTRTFTLRR